MKQVCYFIVALNSYVLLEYLFCEGSRVIFRILDFSNMSFKYIYLRGKSGFYYDFLIEEIIIMVGKKATIFVLQPCEK